jgi:hypothetical protein
MTCAATILKIDRPPAADGEHLDPDQPLSAGEQHLLDNSERMIASLDRAYLRAGAALATIRDKRLYRQTYDTFEQYVRGRWQLTRARAYQLIEAHEISDQMSTMVDIAPSNERQVRALAKLDKDQRVDAWRRAVDTAPIVDGEKRITAKHVQKIVAELLPEPDESLAPQRGAQYLFGPFRTSRMYPGHKVSLLLYEIEYFAKKQPEAAKDCHLARSLRELADEIEKAQAGGEVDG